MTGVIIHIAVLTAALVTPDAGVSGRGAAADGGAGPAGRSPASRAAVEAALAKAGGGADLARLATTAEGTLIAIASDKTAAETLRARALSSLAYARDLRVQSFLENFVVGRTPAFDATDRALVRRAAVALGWQGDPRLVETVAPLLDSADPDVRLDAAIALGLGRARNAEAPLRARLATETDTAVRQQIEAALRAVTAAR
jgi:HEAT repeat protein